tara:strand:- start:201 stop:398 length:198 start_codon:yes stop_codon:yes gene_type:complete
LCLPINPFVWNKKKAAGSVDPATTGKTFNVTLKIDSHHCKSTGNEATLANKGFFWEGSGANDKMS